MAHLGSVSSDRRRSRRTPFTRKLEIAWNLGSGVYIRRIARTQTVSAHGALLLMDSPPPEREPIALKVGPATTMGRVVCSFPPQPDGHVPVAIELSVPNQTIWGAVLSEGN